MDSFENLVAEYNKLTEQKRKCNKHFDYEAYGEMRNLMIKLAKDKTMIDNMCDMLAEDMKRLRLMTVLKNCGLL